MISDFKDFVRLLIVMICTSAHTFVEIVSVISTARRRTDSRVIIMARPVFSTRMSRFPVSHEIKKIALLPSKNRFSVRFSFTNGKNTIL